MKKRKILYISGTRADYGLMRETLFKIKNNSKLDLSIAACGMHIMPEFGNTVQEIKNDNFKVHILNAKFQRDNYESMARFVGKLVGLLVGEVKKIKPDIILLLGDRGEMLAGAIVGAYLKIPVAHIHGGEATMTVDEFARHAITKLSHIHFAVSKKSAERIKKMGEDSWRIFLTGAPGLDSILSHKFSPAKKMAAKYNLDLSKKIILMVQHPAEAEAKESARQIKETLEAIKEIGEQAIIIYPNADAGGREMIKVIKKYENVPFFQIYRSLPHDDYLSLLKLADVLVGNTSSGIVEAPSFGLPVVNIGLRQEGREASANALHVNYDKAKIKAVINRALRDKVFIRKAKNCHSPYGNGRAGEKIAKVLSNIKIDSKLLNKKIAY